MKKNLFVFLFLNVFLISLFAGGGQAGSGRTGTDRTAELQALGFRETGYPIVSQPYTLKVMVSAGSSGYDRRSRPENELEIVRKLETRTGVHVEWEHAGNDWNTQKALVLASGDDLPDVFWNGLLNATDLAQTPEVFTPLDGLIDRYATNLKSIFAEDPFFEKAMRSVDGNIYSLATRLPKYMPIRLVTSINQEWLTKLNLKMPTTTDELYQVLKAFKTGDPNGNGRADEIPATSEAQPEGWNDRSLVDMFCAFIKDYSGDFSVSDGKVWHFITQDGFTDAIAWFHRLYSEGLLDQEMFTQDRAIIEAKLVPPADSPAVIGVGTNYDRGTFGRNRFDQYTVLLPLKGPKGYSGIRYTPNNYQVRVFTGALSSSCKYPEIAMRWIDTLYDPETSLELFYGGLGTRLKKNSDGTYSVRAQPEGYTGIWYYEYGFDTGAPVYASAGTSAKIVPDPDFVPRDNYDRYDSYREKEEVLKPYATYTDYVPSLLPFTNDESLELATLWISALRTLVQQQIALWVTQGGVEREYGTFIQRINTMGLPRVVQIYQTAYDRFNR
jgi:putative aldouronate transport system substrate-binding protein